MMKSPDAIALRSTELGYSPFTFGSFEQAPRISAETMTPLLHVVLYQPDIPPNTGNIGRTCVAIGAKLWLVKPLGFSLDAKQLRRAGLDYWPHLDYEVAEDWPDLLKRLPVERMWFVEKDGANLYSDVQYQLGDVLVFGSETDGIPSGWMDVHRERTVRLPMRKEVRSINLASSAAAISYEVLRQLAATGQIDHYPDAWDPNLPSQGRPDSRD